MKGTAKRRRISWVMVRDSLSLSRGEGGRTSRLASLSVLSYSSFPALLPRLHTSPASLSPADLPSPPLEW